MQSHISLVNKIKLTIVQIWLLELSTCVCCYVNNTSYIFLQWLHNQHVLILIFLERHIFPWLLWVYYSSNQFEICDLHFSFTLLSMYSRQLVSEVVINAIDDLGGIFQLVFCFGLFLGFLGGFRLLSRCFQVFLWF